MYPGYLRFFLMCGGDASGSATCRHVLGHRQSNELLSFRPKVGPLEGVRYDLNRFARWHTPLYKMVNRLLWDVISVNLGFHMCSHCLSMLIPFSQAWQKNDKYRSGESTWSGLTGESTFGRTRPIPKPRAAKRAKLQHLTHWHQKPCIKSLWHLGYLRCDQGSHYRRVIPPIIMRMTPGYPHKSQKGK